MFYGRQFAANQQLERGFGCLELVAEVLEPFDLSQDRRELDGPLLKLES
jgi:hypothetical protein